jgi:hypothetical protein
MKLHEIEFKRRCSINYYRNKKLMLGEMSFFLDWVNDNRGDPYTEISNDTSIKETIADGKYSLVANADGVKTRLIGEYFPFANYELELESFTGGKVGVIVSSPIGELSVYLTKSAVEITCASGEKEVFPAKWNKGEALCVAFQSQGLAVYLKKGEVYKRVGCLRAKMVPALRDEKLFRSTKVFLTASLPKKKSVVFTSVKYYLDCGLSQADMKPVRYEDGTPIVENGKIFLSMTTRNEVGGFQSMWSWNYTTCEFNLEGALFFDAGDGLWCGDVAASVIYDRTSSTWRIWMCSFSHNHVLARGTSVSDPRFGINVIDVELLPVMPDDGDRTQFAGFSGDEDPDLILVDGKWHLTICRLFPESKGYHYCHFVSDNPFDGFTFVDKTPGTQKTGGLFIPTDEGIVFACGSDFNKRAIYDVYPIDDFTDCKNLRCDYDDGGFRGWGTIMMLPVGSRYQYVWITFDRHNAYEHNNWSYGNLYVFVSDTFKLDK